MTPNICRKTSEDHFLEVTPKDSPKKLEDNFLCKFGIIWTKIHCTPKNLLAPTPMARGHQVARTDLVSRPRACSENSSSMISAFTQMFVVNFIK